MYFSNVRHSNQQPVAAKMRVPLKQNLSKELASNTSKPTELTVSHIKQLSAQEGGRAESKVESINSKLAKATV